MFLIVFMPKISSGEFLLESAEIYQIPALHN